MFSFVSPDMDITFLFFFFSFCKGTHFSDRIGTFYKTYENREKVLEFAKTAAGQQMVKTYQENVEHRLPHIWQELNGLAEGSGQPLEEVSCST